MQPVLDKYWGFVIKQNRIGDRIEAAFRKATSKEDGFYWGMSDLAEELKFLSSCAASEGKEEMSTDFANIAEECDNEFHIIVKHPEDD